jgi:hypothetical protein
MFRSRTLGLVASLALAASLLVPLPALAGQAKNLHLGVTHIQFTSFECRPDVDPCVADVTVDAKATSNLSTGAGTAHFDLVVDFFNGFDDPCNFVDETDTFAFAEGTITVESHHMDCALHGLRIDTTFEVTGGTGLFSGASGAGQEFASAAELSAIIYNGTISY